MNNMKLFDNLGKIILLIWLFYVIEIVSRKMIGNIILISIDKFVFYIRNEKYDFDLSQRFERLKVIVILFLI